MNNAFSPFNQLPRPEIGRNATVLIVGPPSVEKAKFGEQMINILANEMTIRIRTAESLPLPSASTPRPRIDFVLFMLSMTQADSFEVFKNSVKKLNEEYFLGRCAVVVTQGKRLEKVTHYTFECAELEYFISNVCGDMHTFYVNLTDQVNVQVIVGQINSLIEVACGYKRGITPALLRATELYESSYTSLEEIWEPKRE
ncbi:6589_t:CDS:2 [Paraglomus brasilianum]|uniref:Centromere protein M n=1 Tax=Paraglomus brasilianum TaxID=144538 RepID=A0A9N8WGW1_9GLOM|nr:6589_t:CDS:2 [Paraglomus brasilianum]